MKLRSYSFVFKQERLEYHFDSVGPRGIIKKVARFTARQDENCFDLSFGDFHETTHLLDDSVVSDNGDREVILATIMIIVSDFMTQFRWTTVFFAGRSSSRNRLYRMSINRYSDLMKDKLEMYGLRNGAWERFDKIIDYQAFLVSRKGNYIFEL